MALRSIVLDGDPILKKNCRPVEKFDERLARLLDDMGETLLAQDGLGLAGPQVGILRRVFVALDENDLPPRAATGEEGADETAAAEPNDEPDGEEEPAPPPVYEFVNPEIIEREGEQRGYEGCLSFPGRFGAIPRPSKVKVRAQNRNGEFFEYEATGMTARCLCHETDHLNGVTIEDLAEYFYDPNVPHELDDTFAASADGDEDGQDEKGGEA